MIADEHNIDRLKITIKNLQSEAERFSDILVRTDSDVYLELLTETVKLRRKAEARLALLEDEKLMREVMYENGL